MVSGVEVVLTTQAAHGVVDGELRFAVSLAAENLTEAEYLWLIHAQKDGRLKVVSA